MKNKAINRTFFLAVLLVGCAMPPHEISSVPSLDYVRQFKSPVQNRNIHTEDTAPKAQLRLVDGGQGDLKPATDRDLVTNDAIAPELPGVTMYRASENLTRDYQGPLDLGDPGVAASLWKESRNTNDILRDNRAWQSGDLITILVTESDQGSRQANTDNKSQTTLSAALSHLFGIVEAFTPRNEANVTPATLLSGSSDIEFKGQGKTDRKNSLTAKISAMVAEVLPTGILRLEGKKIVAVNDEEQIMVLSGLVRTRDINADNEIDSSKIANMRIDYYGKGTVDEATSPGWGTRLIKDVWPF